MSRPSYNTSIDYYQILRLAKNCNDTEIKSQWLKLSQVYHPDTVRRRHLKLVSDQMARTKLTDEQMSKLDESLITKIQESTKIFNLIQQAYHKLSQERKQYDKELTSYENESECDDLKFKQDFESFTMSQKTTLDDSDKEKFRQEWTKLNERHGFNEAQCDRSISVINPQDFNKLVTNLEQERKKTDKEDMPNMVFDLDPKNFNSNSFNAAFDKYNEQSKMLSTYNGVPQPISAHTNNNFCDLDNMNSIYVEGDIVDTGSEIFGNNKYSSINSYPKPGKKITMDDVRQVDDSQYRKNIHKVTDSDKAKMEQHAQAILNEIKSIGTWSEDNYQKDIPDIYRVIKPGMEGTKYQPLDYVDPQTYKRMLPPNHRIESRQIETSGTTSTPRLPPPLRSENTSVKSKTNTGDKLGQLMNQRQLENLMFTQHNQQKIQQTNTIPR